MDGDQTRHPAAFFRVRCEFLNALGPTGTINKTSFLLQHGNGLEMEIETVGAAHRAFPGFRFGRMLLLFHTSELNFIRQGDDDKIHGFRSILN